MKAVTFHGPGDVRVEEVPDPELEAPGDALLRVERSALCGSDLHIYHGDIPGVPPGYVIGHEYVGVIEEAGDGVGRFAEGDRVVGPFHSACGACRPCAHGDFHQCEDGGVFGYGLAFGELQGAQAEYLRVPHADTNLRHLPEGVGPEEALFAGDILTTAFGAVRKARLEPGETCAVIGCGPIGLLVIRCARLFGASRVFGVDLVASRVEAAEAAGAEGVLSGEVNPVSRLQDLTDGRGADVVVEAVGGTETLQLAFDLVRDAGRISAVGITAEATFEFPLVSTLNRDLEFRIGVANIHRDIDRVLDLLAAGRLDPSPLVSHRMSLEEAPRAYEVFADREATKVVLEP